MPKPILSLLVCSLFSVSFPWMPGSVSAAEGGQYLNPIGVEIATLKDQLEKGLKARRPEEFAFVATVVTMVEQDQLPFELVLGTFHWARKQGKYKPYIFPYFEQALRIRARELGIEIQ